MGMIQIQVSDDDRRALEKAHPGETIEAAIQRLIRAEAARAATAPSKEEAAKLLASIRTLARDMNLQLTDDEFRTIRHEGRP
jgi:hypothetical protein